MSPFRVLAVSNDKKVQKILSAILSSTGDCRTIYILDKHRSQEGLTSPDGIRHDAHRMSTKLNSEIIGVYDIEKINESARSGYYVYNKGQRVTAFKQYKLSDCLASAMHHFCVLNGYKVTTVM